MKRRGLLSVAIGGMAAIAMSGIGLGAFTPIVNGGFEDGNYTGNPALFQTLPAGSTSLSGWTIQSGSIDWVQGHWQPHGGIRSIDLNGGVPGAISQTISTTIGNTYVVQFWLSGNPDVAGTKTLSVQATGAAASAYSFPLANTNANMMWQDEAYSFFATSSSTTITFTSTTLSPALVAWGPAIDDVSVTETEATGAMCKKDGWMTMLDQAGNSFKNQGDCVSFFATGGKNAGSIEP